MKSVTCFTCFITQRLRLKVNETKSAGSAGDPAPMKRACVYGSDVDVVSVQRDHVAV